MMEDKMCSMIHDDRTTSKLLTSVFFAVSINKVANCGGHALIARNSLTRIEDDCTKFSFLIVEANKFLQLWMPDFFFCKLARFTLEVNEITRGGTVISRLNHVTTMFFALTVRWLD